MVIVVGFLKDKLWDLKLSFVITLIMCYQYLITDNYSLLQFYPIKNRSQANVYLLKVININSGKYREICSKVTKNHQNDVIDFVNDVINFF